MIIDFPTQAQLPGLRILWKEAFADPEPFLDSFFSVGFSPYRCRCLRRGTAPLAALYWFDCHWGSKRLAYVYAVATAKSHRGQGLCHALMDNTRKHLLQLGYSGIVLVPAKPELFDFYEKMGYRPFSGIRQWECTAGHTAVALEELTVDAYAAARKAILDTDCVLQEGATLRFLHTYARFYQGQDFLLCAALENGKLTGYELLGNTDAAPGILAALGAKKGIFRTPGDAPFGMFLSLTEDPALPGYFAFALD